MKKNKETLQAAMDRRLSFLDDVPSCRAALRYRIAQEEEPAMKKKLSVGLVFAMVLALLSVAALAASLLISPRVSAARIADRGLEETYGITEEMQTFFFRQEEELPDGAVRVTYTGVSGLDYVLGTYTAIVRDGKAEVTWSHDGKEISAGYEGNVWGLEQLKQMMTDSASEKRKMAFLLKAAAHAEKNGTAESEESSVADEHYFERLEAEKTAALEARKLSEEEMIETAREFIITSYGLEEEQIAGLELYTTPAEESGNLWYEMVNGTPCFQVEYLLYPPVSVKDLETGDLKDRRPKDGYYKVYINVETGAVEQYEYNSALGGIG